MRITVAKETKHDERRVALRPDQAEELVTKDHRVLVESQAGLAAGFGDDEYVKAGAEIVSADKVYSQGDLVLKVKSPLKGEVSLYRNGQILFAYLHLDENAPPEYGFSLAKTGVSAIAYEWVEQPEGVFPLLAPMSELTGALFAKKSLELLTEHAGLLGGAYHPMAAPAKVMLIGVGKIGANALNYYLMNCLKVIIVDKHPETIEQRALKFVSGELWKRTSELIEESISFDEERPEEAIARITEVLPSVDILINCAVRRSTLPKDKLEYLITREMIRRMRENRIVIDATGCDADLVETAISSDSLSHTYVDEGVVHYNCDHIPSLAAATATKMLTDQTFPFIELLAEKGFEGAVAASAGLRRGVMIHEGKFYHPYVCEKKGLPLSRWTDAQ